jgi:glycosyltransferase involved in cell wall biosynthesis
MSTKNTSFKILVISNYGSVNGTRPEAEIFIHLAQMGFKIFVLFESLDPYYIERFSTTGIEIIKTPPSKKLSLPYIKFLRKIVREKQIDFVHAYNSKGLTNAVWALIGLPAKLIAYRGSAANIHWYDPVMFTKYFHPRVNHIICNDWNVETYLARNMPWAKNKLTTIPKGHDPKWYEEVSPIDRTILGFSSNDILVCFVANLRPVKGLTWLLRATHILPENLPFKFLFIGHGYDAPEVKKEMQQSPYYSSFHCLGYRSDSLAIMASSDCLVLCSTHAESINKTVIETMSLGIAPIITDIPGNSRLVEDGQSGWVVPIKNATAIAAALMEMASDPNERKRRGINARKHIKQHFHIEQTVEQYKLLYERLTDTQ